MAGSATNAKTAVASVFVSMAACGTSARSAVGAASVSTAACATAARSAVGRASVSMAASAGSARSAVGATYASMAADATTARTALARARTAAWRRAAATAAQLLPRPQLMHSRPATGRPGYDGAMNLPPGAVPTPLRRIQLWFQHCRLYTAVVKMVTMALGGTDGGLLAVATGSALTTHTAHHGGQGRVSKCQWRSGTVVVPCSTRRAARVRVARAGRCRLCFGGQTASNANANAIHGMHQPRAMPHAATQLCGQQIHTNTCCSLGWVDAITTVLTA